MITIGGSVFVRNGIRLDYCFEECLLSLLAFCDQVSVLDCGSTDGTIERLAELAESNTNLQVHANGGWNTGRGKYMLADAANQAKSFLTTDWHFQVLADEVVHQDSIPAIREAAAVRNALGYHCRRWNLYGTADLCVRLDIPAKPCGDRPVRLARLHVGVVDDAEGLNPDGCSSDFEDRIVIVHYGLVRRGSALIEKCMYQQPWYFGSYDPRTLRANKEGVFTTEDFILPASLMPLPCTHPSYMAKWIADRAGDRTKRMRRP